MSNYDYSLSGMANIEWVVVRGVTFAIVCCSQRGHPSNWSFRDEVETRDTWWDVRPDQVVLDVGADFGSYSLPALALGAAKVIAWSPPFKLAEMPLEALTMKMSAWENGFEDRLTVHESGLWSQRGWLAAFDGPRMPQFFGTAAEAKAAIRGQSGHVSAFPVKPLDSMFDQFDRVDWIKIDTEGCELPILRGAEQTLRTFRPKVITENHYHLDPECEFKCDSFLFDLGYKKIGTRPHHSVSHSFYVAEPG